MSGIEFTPEVIGVIVGLLLALVFAYFPVLRVKFGGLKSEVKSLIMIGLLTLTALAITLLSMYKVIEVAGGAVTWALFVKVWFMALIANQPAYTILPQTGDVKKIRAARLL